ncbi:hypothetical protein BKA93DRAFT_822110 [Sparassis latifolia]
MSRLIVKNLPAYLSQERFRAHFEATDGPGGTLTDVKLVSRSDGISRRFGFVGYKTSAEAERAKKWFNRTFVDASRITVDVVDGAKDAPPPRPNKRPRLGPSPAEGETSAAGAEGSKPLKKTSSDAQLEEFMQVMRPRTKKGPSWSNEDAVLQPGVTAAIDSHGASSVVGSKEFPNTADASHDVPHTDKDEARTDTISDIDWLKRRTMHAVEADTDAHSERVFEQSDDEDGNREQHEPDAEETHDTEKEEPAADPVKTTILQTSRLFLRNLSFSCTEDELQDLFKEYDVSQVRIPLDPVTKQPKGLAYVSFLQPASALAAYEVLDKTSFQGRLLHILPAVDRKAKIEGEGDGIQKTVKEQRDAKRKAGAGKEFNWAMLYMNSDAVASSIADRMNIPKADILNPESDNAAVKLALAETHIINETKSFLESHGVILSSLSGSTRLKRSDTAILVKNIPYGTSTDTLRSLFGSHGELRRVLVPPAGTLAVIEFTHAADARTAFRSLAYRRLGNTVIYLEKAPVGVFSDSSPLDSGGRAKEPVVATGVVPVKAPENLALAAADTVTDADEADLPLSAGTTLFVKNLAFSTTSAGLAHAVRHLPGYAFARVQTKNDPARPQVHLSMGYGFVGFRTKEEAKRGMKSLDGFVLDGHVLSVKWAGRGAEGEGAETKGKARSAKMVVKNVPFEATKKDIRELFGAHAQLKSVRLPRKFDHRTRGFAFLEFISPHEAERAYSMLRHTHLLGRHLVLEWAEDGAADVEELRKKAGVGFGGGKEMPGKKRKLEFAEGEGQEGADDD